MTDRKKLSWRCRDIQQQRDKAEIYNSKEWKQLREAKLQQQPLCEMCQEEGRKRGIKRGYVRSATCVHHIVPIETATTKDEMWRLAIGCGLSGLMSLCRPCHHKLHNDACYHTKEAVKERKQSAFERWKERQSKRNNDGTERNQETMCVSSSSDGQGGAARPDDTPTD